MNPETLLASARQLRQPAAATAGEFEAKRDALAAELNRVMGGRPDLERLIGSANRPMMEDNSRNMCRFLGSMLVAYDPDTLVQTVLWVFRAYRSHGFQTTYWPANLDTFVEILRERLSAAAFAEVYPLVHWMIVHIPAFVVASDALVLGASLPSHGAAGAAAKGRV